MQGKTSNFFSCSLVWLRVRRRLVVTLFLSMGNMRENGSKSTTSIGKCWVKLPTNIICIWSDFMLHTIALIIHKFQGARNKFLEWRRVWVWNWRWNAARKSLNFCLSEKTILIFNNFTSVGNLVFGSCWLFLMLVLRTSYFWEKA